MARRESTNKNPALESPALQVDSLNVVTSKNIHWHRRFDRI
jgi:hypothetical protein